MDYCTVDLSGKTFCFYTLPKCPISASLRSKKVWEPYMHAVFEKYIKKDSVVVECGCHIGTHTLKMASLCERLIGFEPMPTTYDILCRNLELNKMENVTILKKGVADRIGETKYCWIPENNPGGAGLANNPMGKPSWMPETTNNIEVDLITIDSLNLSKLDFMKIDVEGYETLVIRGAMETIARCKPVIIMEVWANHYSGVDLNYTKNTFKDLLEIGYDVIRVEGPDFLFVPL